MFYVVFKKCCFNYLRDPRGATLTEGKWVDSFPALMILQNVWYIWQDVGNAKYIRQMNRPFEFSENFPSVISCASPRLQQKARDLNIIYECSDDIEVISATETRRRPTKTRFSWVVNPYPKKYSCNNHVGLLAGQYITKAHGNNKYCWKY